jgi:hypothetical protein
MAYATSGDVHAPAANTAAIVTYAAAGVGRAHALLGVSVSYNADPTGGNFKIEDGAGNIVFTQDLPAKGVYQFQFPSPCIGRANQALILTLAAGGASCTGKVSVTGHRVETISTYDAPATAYVVPTGPAIPNSIT